MTEFESTYYQIIIIFIKNFKTEHIHNHKHKRFVDINENFINPLLELELNRRKRADSDIKDTKTNENNKQQLIDNNKQQILNEIHVESNENAHSAIGVTLVLGFVFMLIVDQIGGKISHRPHMSMFIFIFCFFYLNSII